MSWVAKRHEARVGARYRLLERVGVGGMGTVFRARDERLKREVAVKVIADHLAGLPDAAERFRMEAELAARLSHPNVVEVLDARVAGPEPFIVMQFVRGLNLAALLRRRGRLCPTETVWIVAPVCDALEHAHGHGVVHGDVAPGNILVQASDHSPKLVDFGLAVTCGTKTAGAGWAGTPGHVAPELLDGAALSPGTDLYALGVLVQRLLTGRLPARATPLEGVAPCVREAVERATAPDAEDRQASVAEFRDELVGAVEVPLLSAA